MKSPPTDKWVEPIREGEAVAGVAVRSLRHRLDAVLHYLPLAAEQAGQSGEHVHQLRVWTRRADAALRLYRELTPRRRSRRMRKRLRRVRRAANDARDCDVLLRRLGEAPSGDGHEHWREAV